MKKQFQRFAILLFGVMLLMSATAHAMETNTSNSIEEETDTGTDQDEDSDSDDSDNSGGAGLEELPDTDYDNGSESIDINSKIMLCDNWQIPTVKNGQKVNIVLPLVNMDRYTITDIILTPALSTETSSFPFEIEKTGYAVQLTELLGSDVIADPLERRQEVTYTFTARDDIKTGYYSLAFEAIFKNAEGAEETATIQTYVKAVGKTGAGSGDSASVPRVIVTGFDTVPEDVKAGEDFTLTLHIKNTSTSTSVRNLKFDLQAATEGSDDTVVSQAFLPKEGSSTIFVESIGKDETKDISIELNAKADLAQKPYVLDVRMEYEDESVNQYSSEASVSIPVLQEARFELSDTEIMPAAISVGGEANIMFSIYNTGKTTLYNTKVQFAADSVSGGDTFVGKVEAGGTGNVDAMLSGVAPTADDGTIKILITYEDESGHATTQERTMNMMVTAEEAGFEEDPGMEMLEPEEKEGSGSALPLIIALIVLLAAGAGAIVFVKMKKKKKEKQEEEKLLEDIDDGFDDGYEEAEAEVTEEQAGETEEAEGPEEEAKAQNPDNPAEQKEGDDNEIS